MRMAILVRSPLDPDACVGVYAGIRPTTDYLSFLQTYGGNLVDVHYLMNDQCSPTEGSSYFARTTLPHFDVFLAAGEDIGLRVAKIMNEHSCVRPLNVITHGYLFRNPDRNIKLASMDNVRFLCLSRNIALKLSKEFAVPPTRIRATGYGADLSFFNDSGDRTGANVIVAAGTANRDYRTLLQAVWKMSVTTVIAADSEWHRRKINIGPNDLPPQTFVGSAGNYFQLRELYRRALVVVVPLLPAPFACGYAVISEAMAMRKAVIATRTECHSDLIANGVTGFYVQPGDVNGLRHKIEHLLRNPDIAIEMGLKGRRRMEEKFSHSKYSARIYRAMLKK